MGRPLAITEVLLRLHQKVTRVRMTAENYTLTEADRLRLKTLPASHEFTNPYCTKYSQFKRYPKVPNGSDQGSRGFTAALRQRQR